MRTYNVFLHPRGRVQKLSSISFPVRYPNCSECVCVCVWRRWRRTMAAIVAITELSWTNLTFVPADNFSWLSYRNNNQSGVWDVYLEARSAAKKLLLFQIFPLFQPRHKDTECWVCNRAAWLWLPVNLQSSLCYSFVISSACVCDFSGTGVRMWWHAPWAAWWRTGWRRTSNQTTSAARGASVQEWREYLSLSSSVLHVSGFLFHRRPYHPSALFPVCGLWITQLFLIFPFLFSQESLVEEVSGSVWALL